LIKPVLQHFISVMLSLNSLPGYLFSVILRRWLRHCEYYERTNITDRRNILIHVRINSQLIYFFFF